jgi:hypothetical protein
MLSYDMMSICRGGPEQGQHDPSPKASEIRWPRVFDLSDIFKYLLGMFKYN